MHSEYKLSGGCFVLHGGHYSEGFTLLEVLVALLILSIGALGLASLQLTGLRSLHASTQYGQAVLLAQGISDRVRSNPDGDYNMAAGAQASDICTGACSSGQLVGSDLTEWNNRLAEALPSGVGYICIDSAPSLDDTFDNPGCDGVGDEYAIKIWWDGDGDGVRDQPLIMSFKK